MNLVVQKYGGSSVATTERIKKIAQKVSEKNKSGYKVLIVVSAMGKTTDSLIKLAKEISETPDPRELDMLLSTGEQVSVSLLSMALQSIGLRSKSLNAFQAGIRTTGNFTEAKIVSFDQEKILTMMEELDALVITGFQGITEEGEMTTLGRGGSDTSAVALAAALGIDCEIYSDVAGIYTIDPRLYAAAKKVKYITYDEMLELAGLGAKVLHSRSVEIAKKFGIKLYCGSSFLDEEGSFVVDENIIIEQPVVTGCSIMENQTQVFIKNLPVDYSRIKDLFAKVATENLNVDMISIINMGTNLEVSFTIVQEKTKHINAALKKVLSDLEDWNAEFYSGFIKLSVVGIGMRSGIGVASSFFKALEKIPIRLVTTSEIAISCLIEEKYKHQAVDAIVKEFNL
ncbi:MAG: aspartate kinase [Bacteroidota bacterium]|nr:aspartate kinase [Bacteroidota bacterium]MDP4196370.1 aspartate kinase [Bacteroidota bacterium]